LCDRIIPTAFHPIGRDAGGILTAGRITDSREINSLSSARVSRAGERVLAIANFFYAANSFLRFTFKENTVLARRQNQHARRVRHPERIACAMPKPATRAYRI
jgi:hypothetical protein